MPEASAKRSVVIAGHHAVARLKPVIGDWRPVTVR
jgi:hypothetical protein